MVHEIFSEKLITQLMVKHPKAKVIAHPECEAPVLKLAHYIGSTKQLLEYTQKDAAAEFIVVTEAGIIHQMEKASPGKTFIPAPPDNGCACNECPHMRLNTMEKLYRCMRRSGRGRAQAVEADAGLELTSNAFLFRTRLAVARRKEGKDGRAS
jgi:quinolinate synthase